MNRLHFNLCLTAILFTAHSFAADDLKKVVSALDGYRLVLLATAGVDLPRHGGQGPRRAVLRLTALTEAVP